MKKTLIYNVKSKRVMGFSNANVDPVETMKKVNPKLKKTPENKKLDEIKSTLVSSSRAQYRANFDAKSVFYKCALRKKISDREMSFLLSTNVSKAKEYLNASEISELDKHNLICLKRYEESKEIMNASKSEIDKLKSKRLQLIESEAVYFGCRPGEVVLEDDEFESIYKKYNELKNDEFLSVKVDDKGVVVRPLVVD